MLREDCAGETCEGEIGPEARPPVLLLGEKAELRRLPSAGDPKRGEMGPKGALAGMGTGDARELGPLDRFESCPLNCTCCSSGPLDRRDAASTPAKSAPAPAEALRFGAGAAEAPELAGAGFLPESLRRRLVLPEWRRAFAGSPSAAAPPPLEAEVMGPTDGEGTAEEDEAAVAAEAAAAVAADPAMVVDSLVECNGACSVAGCVSLAAADVLLACALRGVGAAAAEAAADC